MNNIGAPTGDLEGHLDRMIVDTSVLGNSAAELGEGMSVWAKYSAGIMMRTFLASKTESRMDDTCTAKFNHRPLGSQSQVSSDQKVVCSCVSHPNKLPPCKPYVCIAEGEKSC